MLKKIEHIGIAVKDLKTSNELFKKLLGVPHYKTEQVVSEGVTTSFFDVGTHKIELLEATSKRKVLNRALQANSPLKIAFGY